MNGRAHELLDDYEAALRDLLYFYDKIRGAVGHGEGWTVADVLRLEQIRALTANLPSSFARVPPKADSRALQAHSRPNGSGKPPKPRKARKTRPRRS